MKILTVLIFMSILVACSAVKKSQPNYQLEPTTAQTNIGQSQTSNDLQTLAKKTKKNPHPKNYYPVPHTINY